MGAKRLFSFALVGWLLPWVVPGVAAEVVDLSVLVAPDLPCVWPQDMQQYVLTPSRRIGPRAYNRDLVMIDEHTGTQWDAPAHFVPPPDSGLPGGGPTGRLTSEKIPAWQFVGEACVIDVSAHVDDAVRGSSYLIRPDVVERWEQAHRRVGPGDVVLFRSGYSDRYYVKLPEGRRYVVSGIAEETPAWPAPTPQCMKFLGERKVMAAGIDSPSMGPMPDLAAATHVAGAQYGMIWTESVTGLGALPATGAFYALLAPKHFGGSGGEARVLAITEPELAARLIEKARAKRVVDLSVLLHENYPVTWTGESVGTGAAVYQGTTLHNFGRTRGGYFARAHIMDALAGTHVVPPSFALPSSDKAARPYAPQIRKLLEKFEARFGGRGTSNMTVDKIPLDQLVGSAVVIDVKRLVNTTNKSEWPASPAITLAHIREHEQRVAPIQAGDIVIFHSGYSDQHFQPFPAGNRLFVEALSGAAEGWPAPTPEVIVYLAEKGVRCLGTDGPTLGGVDSDQALMVNWAAASRGMCAVELLTGVGKLPATGAFFLFGPVKLKGGHGGYGRALGLY